MKILSLGKLIVMSPWYAAQSKKQGDNRHLFLISKDVVSLWCNYGVSGPLYLKDKVGLMSSQERETYLSDREEKRRYSKLYHDNWAFLAKYADFSYQVSRKKRKERNKAYIDRFHMGEHCVIQYGVKFVFEHHSIGKVSIGDNILFARDVDVDITGDLTICDGTRIAENVKILTHKHTYFDGDDSHGLELTPLVIQDHVHFGARVMVLPGVEEIGRGAILSSGAVIRKKVPPYAIVNGNPSKVVGFRFTPNQILEYEKTNYPPENRLPEDLLIKNYQKYYLDKLNEIRSFLM